tara:strand:- start:246 stop:419 length:174 start_codon:yes stop_codon:yes gene_type:complete
MINQVKYGGNRIIKIIRSGAVDFVNLYVLSKFKTGKSNCNSTNRIKKFKGKGVKNGF